MRLGNSSGQNKGKKYFVRGRDDQDLDVVYAEKAEEFAEWFRENYLATKRQLIGKSGYDEDVFNETYIRIYEIILFTGRKIQDFGSYFHRAYYTNFVQDRTKLSRYCELFPNYDVEDEEDGEQQTEIDIKSRMLGDDIILYVYDNYDIREFEIFKMYINLKPAINYHSLAQMTDNKYHVIQRMISTIIQDIKDNDVLMIRRYELVGA